MTRKLYDIAAKTGEYTRNGETKARWQTVGAVMENEAGQFLLMDRTFNLAGMPMDERGSDRVMLKCFEPRDEQRQQRTVGERRDAPERGVDREGSRRATEFQRPPRQQADLDDDIAF